MGPNPLAGDSGCRAKRDEAGTTKMEKMDVNGLANLKINFDEADEDGGGDLSEGEFVAAFEEEFPELSNLQLRHLFMKIDANSDGSHQAARAGLTRVCVVRDG